MKRFLSLLLTIAVLLCVSVSPAAAAGSVTKIIPEYVNLTLEPGATWAMFWETEPAGAATRLTWQSSNVNVASVNSYGVIYARKKGECQITATALNGPRATINVTVKEHDITILEPGDVDVDFETAEDTVKITLTIDGTASTKKANRFFKTKNECVTSPEDMVIHPVKAGSDTISIAYYIKKSLMKSEPHTVFVSQNAVGEAPRLTENGEPAPVLFLNIPWGSNWPTTVQLMEARGRTLKAISVRNNYLRSMVSGGEITFGNLTAFTAALNYSYQQNDRMFETRNAFNNGDLYFDPSVPFESIARTARTLYCLDEGERDGDVLTWHRGHVTVRMEKKERYTILEVTWDGVDEEEAGEDDEGGTETLD